MRVCRLLVEACVLGLSARLFGLVFDRLGARYLIAIPWYAWLVPAGLLFSLFLRPLWRVLNETRASIAAELDDRFKLQERLGACQDLRGTGHPFLPALVADTEAKIRNVPVLRAARLGEGAAPILALLLSLLFVVALIPLLPIPASVVEKGREREQVKRAAAVLQNATKLLRPNPKQPEAARLVQHFQETAGEMEKLGAQRTDALRRIGALELETERARRAVAQSTQQDLLDDLARSAKGSPQAEQLLADMQNANGNPDAAELSSGGGSQLTPEQRKQMEKALEDYREEKGRTDRQFAQLEDSLRNARSQIVPGSHMVTYNSKLDDRGIEKGKSGVDDGPGTTNKDVGPGTFDTTKHGQGKYIEDRTRAGYEQLYKGEHIEAGKQPVYLPGEVNAEQAKYARVRTFGAGSHIELQEVPVNKPAQDSNESAIRKEKIPAAYRRLIQRYFDSIEE